MRLNIFPKLLGIIILTMTLASTSTLTELQGTKNLSETDLKRMVKQLESIKFKTIFKNERVDTKYYKKYKEKNLELLNFYTVTDLETMHELLIENPDFALYAPFTFLAYQHLEKEKDNNITWYGHLMTDTMLDIIGEKDKILQEKFKVMVAKLDSLVAQELKPTEVKKMTFDKPLPKEPIFKMVKDISNVDDIEGFVEEFIMEYDSLFVENHFLLAGVADFKMEYEDLDLEFEKYDAFWVSPICHLEFTNTIFNRAIPQAGVLAPCTVYFYVPKGSGKLYVGYVPLEHWISMADINNEAQITAIKKTSADMIQVFKELGFKMNIEVAKAEVKKVEAVAVKATEVKEEIEKAKAGESVLVEFYGTKGQPDAELGAMIDNLGKIGFNTSAKNEHIENHYYNKFKEKNLDLLSFYTLFDIESLRPLLLKNPDFGAYAPFNLLAYKKLKDAEGGDTTWYGHLNVETMLKIIGESDEETKEKFRVMMSKVDKHVEAEMKPTERKTLSYSAALPEKPLLKMVKKIGEVEDIEEYVEEFIPKHNLLFKNNKFIIAGFLDVKFEYEDLELEFDKYDAYWVSSLCHFEFSNAVFNQGDPHAGAFAPCSVYFYIPKGSGEIHVGYASVDNWLATTGITDPKKIAYMKEISASVIRIFKELGFEMKEELEVKQKEKAEVEKAEAVAVKATEVKETANTIKIVIPTVPKVNVAIPEPVTVAIGVEKEDISERGLDDRRIQYESRIPPGYMTSEERYKQNTKKASVMVGEVDKGRISTYLRTGLISIDEAKAKLEKAGFQIITVVSLDKKKQLTSIVFTSDALKKMSSKENRGHLATLRLLINEKDKRVSITNPLYLAKAFLENEFVKEDAVKILTSIVSEFKGIQNSSDKLKFQLLPKYQFMNNLPYFKDHIVVARGDNLKAKLVNNKRVAFSLDLANGATLIGVKLNKRTQKFPKQIGLDNAGMLPYPLLIENGEAKILNPKYYISLMYPKLTMEEFMTIATVPDGIENDCAKVFR